MAAFVSLLRGINVGGHRRVPMGELREVCVAAGLTGVRSYIQSGNLVFDGTAGPAEMEGLLEAAIAERFGFPVAVIARTAAQWSGYVTGNPFADVAATAPTKVMLVLSRPPLDPATGDRLRSLATDGEEIASVGDVLYLHLPAGAGRSRLAAAFGRLPSTARNWRTVAALAAMVGS